MAEMMMQILDSKQAPNIATHNTYGILKSSDYQFIKDIEDMQDKWLSADKKNRDRLFDNLNCFFALYGSQWDIDALNDLKSQGRHPVQFNVAEQKLRTLAGSIQAEKFDFNFLPVFQGEGYAYLKKMKYLYSADKEQYNYTAVENKTLLRGLIQLGIEEIDVKYDIRKSGAIVFNSTLPGQVLKDPFWQSDDLKDWRRAIKQGWFTAREIMEKYKTDDAYIVRQAELDKLHGENYEEVGDIDAHKDSNPTWGSKYLVVEFRWLEKVKATRLHGRRSDRSIVNFPVGVKKEQLPILMKMNGIESYEDVFEMPYADDVLYQAAVCPTLSRTAILTKGKHYIQCGTIGFFPFSGCRELGVDKGVMDSYIDIQRSLNYRESKKDDVLASAASGAVAVDVSRFDNPERDFEEFKKNKTKPDYVAKVNGDPSTFMAKIPVGEVPESIWRDIAGLVDMFDRVGPVTPSLEGRTTENESGVLFEMRNQVSKLGTLILYDNWMQHHADKAEAWYNQAQITYKNIYIEAKNTDTGEMIEFNSPTFQDGKRGYENDIAAFPRSRVIVTLSKSSPSEQYAKRGMLYDMTKIFSAHPDLFKAQIHTVVNQMIETLELSPEERIQHKMVAQLQRQNDVMELMSQASQMNAGTLNAQVMAAQAMQMLQQLTGGQQQQQGGQPGGQPGGENQITFAEEGGGGAPQEAEFTEVPGGLQEGQMPPEGQLQEEIGAGAL